MAKSGAGMYIAFGVLATLALHACGRSATKDGDVVSVAGQPSCEEDDCELPGTGGAASLGGNGSGIDGSAGEFAYVSGAPGAQGGSGPIESCTPGRSCDGPSVVLCAKDGQSQIEETCSLSQICSDGKCQDITCVPNATFCREQQILKCNAEGTAGKALETCGDDQYCIDREGEALCSESPCIANEPLCLNETATSCKSDGSGPKPGGQNCAASGAVCSDGKCVGQICTPGDKQCQHDDVYVCDAAGANAVLFTSCQADEACDPELAACRNRICEPGKLGCDDTRVAKCDALGLGWLQSGTDCSESNQLCISGACKTQICVPSATFCKNSDVYQCDANGVSSSLYENCNDTYYHCVPYYYGDQAYCTSNNCVPGTVMCDGNLVTKCASDGSGAEPGGTACGSDSVCSNGACQAKVCDPNQAFCKDGDLAYCYYNSIDYYIQQDCGTDARCATSSSGYLACVPFNCSPGLKACLGNQVGTCADDGVALGSVKQNCTTTDEVCTSGSACASSAVDTLGAAEELQSLTTDYFFGDLIDVQSNRELTQIEANIVLAGSRSLRWVVFELVGSYYEARYDKLVADQTGTGYLSSGAVSYTLKAGRRYLLGVAVSGGGFVPYYDAKPWQPELSFGKAVGGMATYYATSLYDYGSNDRVYDLRFTTQLP